MAKSLLTYPSNLSEIVPSFLQLSIGKTPKEYHKQVFTDPTQLGNKVDIYQTINLPIPAGLLDNVDAVWSNEATSSITQGIANKFMDGRIGTVTKVSQGIHGERHVMHEFSNINAKVYNLSWIFVPQNSGESFEIESIIKSFKRAQLPEVVDGLHAVVRAFRLPDMVLLKVIGEGGKWTKFLPCFIISVYIDKNFDDTYIEYPDGTTPTTTLNIQLIEITGYTKQIFDEVYGS